MLEFLLKLTHKKSCKKEQCPCIQKQEPTTTENTIQIPEKIVAEINYEKLANAIIEANEKIEEKKKEKEREEYEQQEANWQIALFGKKLGEDEKPSNWQIFKGLMFFKKKYATGDNAIYALLKIVNNFLFWLYECILCILSCLSTMYLILSLKTIMENTNNLSLFLSTLQTQIAGICIAIILIIFPVIIARIIRVARLQINNCKDKQFIVTISNFLITFTALVIAIMTIIVTTDCGCVCVQ